MFRRLFYFRRLITERKTLINQWCLTIEKQKQRDKDIENRRNQLDELKEEVSNELSKMIIENNISALSTNLKNL